MPVYIDTFGDRVREVMKERRLSPYEVERRANGGISHQTVRNMMRGVAAYSDYIVAFAEAVGDTPEEETTLANELLHLAGRRLIVPVREVVPANGGPGAGTGPRTRPRTNVGAAQPEGKRLIYGPTRSSATPPQDVQMPHVLAAAALRRFLPAESRLHV